MRIATIIPDGTGVRNFVLGKFLRSLPPEDEAHVFHCIPDKILPQLLNGSTNGHVEWHELRHFCPPKVTDLLHGSLAFAQMYWASTMAMRRTLSLPIRGPLTRCCLQHSKRLLGRIAASPRRMQWLEDKVFRLLRGTQEVETYLKEFRRIRPTVLFSSQQLSMDAVPAVVAAKELGIPSAAFIFSWDNLTSKGRIVAPFDHYLVWSRHMRDELLRYYPFVRPEKVHVVGTPQFEPYTDSSLIRTREEFCAQIGADPSRPLICYSGGDAGTCPEDPEHVRVLLELIASRRVTNNPQVVLRPTPVDDGRRYSQVFNQHPGLIFSPPKWLHGTNGDWTGFMPTAADIQLLANLTHHADLNVNLGSTMILDFGMHDKPVVNIAFDVADPPVFGMPVFDFYYGYEHLRPVLEFKATRVARSVDELAAHVNAYFRDPALDREGRKRLIDLEVHQPLGRSTERLIRTLAAISV